RYQWSFSNLSYFLRMNFFVYRDLWEWPDHPFADPPPFNGVSAVGACMGITWTAFDRCHFEIVPTKRFGKTSSSKTSSVYFVSKMVAVCRQRFMRAYTLTRLTV